MIEALVFDFDGLILDTEVPDYESWRELYEEHGCDLSRELWCAAIGRGASEMPFSPLALLESQAGRPLDQDAIRARRRARYLGLIHAERVLPGVVTLIDAAQERGLKLAVASSSDRAWVTGHLERLGLLSRFSAVKTADDVARTKPAPDLYLAAVEALNVAPARALALEDSAHGVTAARSAGLWCVAVPNAMTRELPLHHADLRLQSLADLTLEGLLEALEKTR